MVVLQQCCHSATGELYSTMVTALLQYYRQLQEYYLKLNVLKIIQIATQKTFIST